MPLWSKPTNGDIESIYQQRKVIKTRSGIKSGVCYSFPRGTLFRS